MTPQEILDFVAPQLIAQGCRSVRSAHNADSACAYRGFRNDGKPGPAKCGVGFLIPDELYVPAMDDFTSHGTSVRSLVERAACGEFKIPEVLIENVEFLVELQQVHDTDLNWPDVRSSLVYLANTNGLKVNF
jgi:hypothetical protein